MVIWFGRGYVEERWYHRVWRQMVVDEKCGIEIEIFEIRTGDGSENECLL
jgi:hypothetical protein